MSDPHSISMPPASIAAHPTLFPRPCLSGQVRVCHHWSQWGPGIGTVVERSCGSGTGRVAACRVSCNFGRLGLGDGSSLRWAESVHSALVSVRVQVQATVIPDG